MLEDGEPNPEVQGSAANVTNIDEFFGTKAWRQIAMNGKSSKEQEAEYLELYFDSVVGPGFSCKHAYPVSATYGGKPNYYLVHIADHPDADWLINDLLASVESRLYNISCQRERPDTLTGFCLALRPGFFGKLKEGDYSKAVKQLFNDGRVLREQKGARPRLLEHELISLPDPS